MDKNSFVCGFLVGVAVNTVFVVLVFLLLENSPK